MQVKDTATHEKGTLTNSHPAVMLRDPRGCLSMIIRADGFNAGYAEEEKTSGFPRPPGRFLAKHAGDAEKKNI